MRSCLEKPSTVCNTNTGERAASSASEARLRALPVSQLLRFLRAPAAAATRTACTGTALGLRPLPRRCKAPRGDTQLPTVWTAR